MSESETSFKIENDVPMPHRSEPIPDLPLNSMAIGDSFLIKGVAKSPEREGAVRQRMYRYQRNNHPKRFSLVRDKRVDGAMRLFRVQDAVPTE